MNKHYLYLIVDLLSFVVPFAFSFHRRINFIGHWRSVLAAIWFPAVFFILWDELFAHMGIWGFDPAYVTGLWFYDVPVEEILFFFCIPYACLFTYESLRTPLFARLENFSAWSGIVTSVLIVVLLFVGIRNYNHVYTAVSFILLGALLFLLRKREWMGKFYVFFVIVLIPFSLVNGLLTSVVVLYNTKAILGIRLGTIPAEDIFYGMLLLLMNVAILEQSKKKAPLRSGSPEQRGA